MKNFNYIKNTNIILILIFIFIIFIACFYKYKSFLEGYSECVITSPPPTDPPPTNPPVITQVPIFTAAPVVITDPPQTNPPQTDPPQTNPPEPTPCVLNVPCSNFTASQCITDCTSSIDNTSCVMYNGACSKPTDAPVQTTASPITDNFNFTNPNIGGQGYWVLGNGTVIPGWTINTGPSGSQFQLFQGVSNAYDVKNFFSSLKNKKGQYLAICTKPENLPIAPITGAFDGIGSATFFINLSPGNYIWSFQIAGGMGYYDPSLTIYPMVYYQGTTPNQSLLTGGIFEITKSKNSPLNKLWRTLPSQGIADANPMTAIADGNWYTQTVPFTAPQSGYYTFTYAFKYGGDPNTTKRYYLAVGNNKIINKKVG